MTDRAALLDLLLADPSKAAGVPREDAVSLLAQMAAVQSLLVARIVGATTASNAILLAPKPPDRLLTVAEVAERLRKPVRWVYRQARRWPFVRRLSPRVLRFPEAELERWIARTRA